MRAPSTQTQYATNGLPTLNQEINQSPYFTNYSTNTDYLQDYNNRLAQESTSTPVTQSSSIQRSTKNMSNVHSQTLQQQAVLQTVQTMINLNDYTNQRQGSSQLA